MTDTSWFKQTGDKPLFPDILWGRPETRARAGKLLIIGGNEHVFAAPAEAYEQSKRAGIGTPKVLLPDRLQKTIGQVLSDCEFAPTNRSGSFAKVSLSEWLSFAAWADGVLLAGDMGRNSETAIVLEEFVNKYTGQLTITQDSLDQFLATPAKLFGRPNTTIVASFAQLQKMWSAYQQSEALTYGDSLVRIVDLLQKFSKSIVANIVTKHQDELVIAVSGRVSTTKISEEVWRIKLSAHLSTWWLQNPEQAFPALNCAVYNYQRMVGGEGLEPS